MSFNFHERPKQLTISAWCHGLDSLKWAWTCPGTQDFQGIHLYEPEAFMSLTAARKASDGIVWSQISSLG